MTDLADKVIAGSEAKYILEHPTFNKAFTSLRDSIIAQIRTVKPRDKEMHTELVRWMQTLDRFEACFRDSIRTGELAKAEIKHQQTMTEQLKAMGERVFSRD